MLLWRTLRCEGVLEGSRGSRQRQTWKKEKYCAFTEALVFQGTSWEFRDFWHVFSETYLEMVSIVLFYMHTWPWGHINWARSSPVLWYFVWSGSKEAFPLWKRPNFGSLEQAFPASLAGIFQKILCPVVLCLVNRFKPENQATLWEPLATAVGKVVSEHNWSTFDLCLPH